MGTARRFWGAILVLAVGQLLVTYTLFTLGIHWVYILPEFIAAVIGVVFSVMKLVLARRQRWVSVVHVILCVIAAIWAGFTLFFMFVLNISVYFGHFSRPASGNLEATDRANMALMAVEDDAPLNTLFTHASPK